ncbi:iron-containing alcohol dehydrogenase [Mycobacterium sp. 21AC1]|uniref:iron-containing alcohol dehydrogenase family protein n=1 Tax=[Mycobacterium] appelbergii TaxID=2939269 RepID=UPI002938E4A0|nr:iron-containing alcohol dehydrogenase [Mycobacterium sp. 21AC1]MDV3125438.1 iron-containing alcohol dehydrogenase [Mycobacterium sp. 21AC1]
MTDLATPTARVRDPLRPVTYSLPTTIVFGRDVLTQLPDITRETGIRYPLIVTDRGLAATDIPDRVTATLREAGFRYEQFTDVESDPSTELVDRIGTLLVQNSHDGVIGLGGGSAMDAAKAAAAVATNGVGAAELTGPEKVRVEPLPVIAIPTTAGPGSEVTKFAVLTDHAAGAKLSIASMAIMPKWAILDPALTVGLPPKFTLATGLDALCHAIESYGSAWNNPISEGMALQAISLIGANLRSAYHVPGNLEARAGMLAASCIAELAANTTRLGLGHALGVPMGATHGVPHGLAVGMMLPPMCRFNAEVEPQRYQRVAAALDPTAGDLNAALSALYRDIDMDSRLSQFGVAPGDFDRIIDLAVRSDNVLANPREARRQDLAALLQEAL